MKSKGAMLNYLGTMTTSLFSLFKMVPTSARSQYDVYGTEGILKIIKI